MQRFNQNGFNLDLSYITDNCIVMSLPAEGLEAREYNDISEVSRFFRTIHTTRKDGFQFLIFNVTAERSYNHEFFSGQVVNTPIEPDSTPTLEQLCHYVERASEWVISSQRVIAIHDLQGLARSGVFAIAWLLFSGFTSASSVSLCSDCCSSIVPSFLLSLHELNAKDMLGKQLREEVGTGLNL